MVVFTMDVDTVCVQFFDASRATTTTTAQATILPECGEIHIMRFNDRLERLHTYTRIRRFTTRIQYVFLNLTVDTFGRSFVRSFELLVFIFSMSVLVVVSARAPFSSFITLYNNTQHRRLIADLMHTHMRFSYSLDSFSTTIFRYFLSRICGQQTIIIQWIHSIH